MADDSLQDSLDELRQEGRIESQGAFTVDLIRSGELMKKFMLAEPRAFVMNLVSSAVLAGAENIYVRIDSDDCEISHDGNQPCSEELQSLLAHTLREDARGDLRELALGLTAALALDPRRLTVETIGQEQSWLLMFSKDTVEVSETQEHGSPQVRIHLKEALSFKMLMRVVEGRQETQFLRRRCRYSPVPILLNGGHMTSRPALNQGLAAAIISSGGKHPVRVREPELPLLELQNSDFSGAVYFTRRAESRADVFWIVLNGVLFDWDTQALGWQGAGAIVFCSDLSKDLSQDGIVEDDAFQSLVAELSGALEQLADYIIERWQDLPAKVRLRRADILDQAVEAAQAKNDSKRLVEVCQACTTALATTLGEDASETCAMRLRLGLALEADERFNPAYELYREEAARAKHSGQWSAQRQVLLRAMRLLEDELPQRADERAQLLEELVICHSRLGDIASGRAVLLRLEPLLADHDDDEEKLERLRAALEPGAALANAGPSRAECSRCHGTRLLKNCPLIGREGAELQVQVGERNPDAMVFRNAIRIPLQASVCCDCGHTELMVDDPDEVWRQVRGL